MAETLIRAELEAAGLADRVRVESAGTGDWHLGEQMDRGARAELKRRGYDGAAHRARQIGPDWLDRFDLLIAMDSSNLRALQAMASRAGTGPGRGAAWTDEPGFGEEGRQHLKRPGHRGVPGGRPPGLALLRSFDPQAPEGAEVPDPYGAGPDEFARVFDLIAAAAKGLVAELAAMFDGARDG